MKFDISGITHIGTLRNVNQDRILVNGHLLDSGEVHLAEQNICRCFVADGVGGNRAGEFASNFVLEKINSLSDLTESNFEQPLDDINRQLLSISNNLTNVAGTATTLTGLVMDGENFLVIHCGDSQMWLFRNEMFFKLTNDQVLDENQENSPITSFFGGLNDNLKFDRKIFVNESAVGDVFLICSDGLFKALDKKSVKSILKSGDNYQAKTRRLIEDCLLNGAEDNVSVILIERTD